MAAHFRNASHATYANGASFRHCRQGRKRLDFARAQVDFQTVADVSIRMTFGNLDGLWHR